MVLLVWSFSLALFLVLSAANPILRDPAPILRDHSPLSTLLSDDKSKAHAAVQHLRWVHKLQLSWIVKSVLYVDEAYQEFSPSCHLPEEVKFFLQLAIYLLCLMLMKRPSIDLEFLIFQNIL